MFFSVGKIYQIKIQNNHNIFSNHNIFEKNKSKKSIGTLYIKQPFLVLENFGIDHEDKIIEREVLKIITKNIIGYVFARVRD